MKRLLIPALSAILLYGCESSPVPVLPAGDVPANFEQGVSAKAEIWAPGDWWKAFGDPQLVQFVEQARGENLEIAQAAARLRQADARARQAGAALLPSVSLNGNVNSLYGQGNGSSQHETDYGASLGASYELDFWGKIRDAADAASYARQASAADKATVELTAESGIANTYFQLLALRERLAVANENLKTSQEILAIVERRIGAGYAASSERTQQRAAIAADRSGIFPLEQQALEARTALAIALGKPPELFSVTGDNLENVRIPTVQPGLPSGLLLRRPDISSAEENLKAAHADLDAARKAFLPNITLTATGGFAYPALAAAVDTLPGAGLAAGAAASLAQAVFDGGRNRAKTAEAKAREEELLAAYRSSVLTAFGEVENALGSIQHLSRQEALLKEQVTQDEAVLRSARRKYLAGYADFLTVIDAQRTLFAARDQYSEVRRARLVAAVTLYKVLGGGWISGPS